jgi:hypothetical protein
MWSTQLSIQWVPVVLSTRISGPEGAVEYLPPSIVEINNMWSCISTTTHVFVVNTGFILPLKLILPRHFTPWEIAARTN